MLSVVVVRLIVPLRCSFARFCGIHQVRFAHPVLGVLRLLSQASVGQQRA